MILTWQNTAADIKGNPPRLAILPLSGSSQYDPSFPASANQILIDEAALRVAGMLSGPVFVLPAWPFEMDEGPAAGMDQVSIKFETLWSVVADLVLSLRAHDIRRVAVLNGLGSTLGSATYPTGNSIVKSAVRQLNYDFPDLTILWVQPFVAGQHAIEQLFPDFALPDLDHMTKSSIFLYLASQPVNTSTSEPGLIRIYPAETSSAMDYEVSAARGKQALDAIVEATAGYIERTFLQLEKIKSGLGDPGDIDR